MIFSNPNHPLAISGFTAFEPLDPKHTWQYFSLQPTPKMQPFYNWDDVLLFNYVLKTKLDVLKSQNMENSGMWCPQAKIVALPSSGSGFQTLVLVLVGVSVLALVVAFFVQCLRKPKRYWINRKTSY